MPKNRIFLMIGVFLFCVIAMLILKIVGTVAFEIGIGLVLLVVAYFWLTHKMDNKRE